MVQANVNLKKGPYQCLKWIDLWCQVIGSMRGRELQNEATPFCMSHVYYMFWERWFYIFLILFNDVWCKGTTQNGETCHILRHHCFLGSTADHKCLEAWCAVLAAAATSGGMAESCFFIFRMCSKTRGSRWETVPKAPNRDDVFCTSTELFWLNAFGCLVIVPTWILICRSVCCKAPLLIRLI